MSRVLRLGNEVARQVRLELIRRVHDGDVKYARKVTLSRTVIVLDYGGEEIAFLYSSASKEILSFLPPGAGDEGEWRGARGMARRVFSIPSAPPSAVPPPEAS